MGGSPDALDPARLPCLGLDERREWTMSEPVGEGGRFQAILLPGGVMPAELAYVDLVRALGPEVDARPKELELYADSEPPAEWGLQTEVEGIRRFADKAGFER